MKVKIVILTPELATELLQKNTINRPVTWTKVDEWASMMRAGAWKQNGDTVRLSTCDTLLDGQHRCHAVIKSGVAIDVIMVEGLDRSVFDTIDSGKKRSAADVLGAVGEKNRTCLSACLARVEDLICGRRPSTKAAQNNDVLGLLQKYPKATDSVALISNTASHTGVPPSLLSALHYVFSTIDRDSADQFVVDLAKGAGLTDSDPIYVLRERMLKEKMGKSKLPTHEVCALCIKAWNHRMAGKTVRALRWRNDENRPEAFPKISGLAA